VRAEKLVDALVREPKEFGCVPPRESNVIEGPGGIYRRGCRFLFSASGLVATAQGEVGRATRWCWQLDPKLDDDVAAVDVGVAFACVDTFNLQPQRDGVLQVSS
jgi:hypothetical protein